MDLPDTSSVPPAIQWLAYVAGALGLGFAGLRHYRKGEPSSDDVILPSTTIADMRPVRDIAESLRRLADAVEDIRLMMKREATIDDLARDAESAMREAKRRIEDEESRERDRRGR